MLASAFSVTQRLRRHFLRNFRRSEKPYFIGVLAGLCPSSHLSAKQAAIAIANKTARIAWAIMVHGGVYEVGHRTPQYRAEACAVTG